MPLLVCGCGAALQRAVWFQRLISGRAAETLPAQTALARQTPSVSESDGEGERGDSGTVEMTLSPWRAETRAKRPHTWLCMEINSFWRTKQNLPGKSFHGNRVEESSDEKHSLQKLIQFRVYRL